MLLVFLNAILCAVAFVVGMACGYNKGHAAGVREGMRRVLHGGR